jgi:hypothetical protein
MVHLEVVVAAMVVIFLAQRLMARWKLLPGNAKLPPGPKGRVLTTEIARKLLEDADCL